MIIRSMASIAYLMHNVMCFTEKKVKVRKKHKNRWRARRGRGRKMKWKKGGKT